jgi:RNA polymerase sigma factor (sigma-70 family)
MSGGNMKSNGNDDDECFWDAIDSYRGTSSNPNVDDETRRKAAERFFGHESMVRTMCLILSVLRRGRSAYECQFIGDLLNDIVLRVMQGIADFRGGNEKVFWRWLWQIVHNTSVSSLHSAQTDRRVFYEDVEAVECASRDYPSDGILLKEEWFKTLSERQRFIMDLRIEGHTFEEIAESLGLSISHTQREATTAQKALVAMMLGRIPAKAASPKARKNADNLKGEKRDEH